MKDAFLNTLMSALRITNNRANAVVQQTLGSGGYQSLIRDTTVEPRCFISLDLKHSEYLEDILQVSLNVFASYYLRAAQILDPSVRKVAVDVLSSLNADTDDLWRSSENVSSMEDFSKGMPLQPALEADNNVTDSSPMVIGKTVKVTLSKAKDANGSTGTVSIDVLLRLHSLFVPSEVMVKFLSGQGYADSWIMRYKKWRASAISNADFFLNRDLIKRRKKLMLMDENDILLEISKRQKKAIANAAKSGKRNYGVSNEISIISSDVARKLERTSGGELRKPMVRDKFMSNLGLFLLVIVDLEHEMATVYYSGSKFGTTVSLKNIAKINRKDGPDIADVMKTLQSGGRTVF